MKNPNHRKRGPGRKHQQGPTDSRYANGYVATNHQQHQPQHHEEEGAIRWSVENGEEVFHNGVWKNQPSADIDELDNYEWSTNENP